LYHRERGNGAATKKRIPAATEGTGENWTQKSFDVTKTELWGNQNRKGYGENIKAKKKKCVL